MNLLWRLSQILLSRFKRVETIVHCGPLKRRPLKSAPSSFHQQRRILQISFGPPQRLDHTRVPGRCASATLGLGAATFAVGRLKSCITGCLKSLQHFLRFEIWFLLEPTQ
jgi:hypothetical protein